MNYCFHLIILLIFTGFLKLPSSFFEVLTIKWIFLNGFLLINCNFL
jgi:hypothetical protein